MEDTKKGKKMKDDIKFGRHEKTHHKKSDERKEFEKLEKIADYVFDYIQCQEGCIKMDRGSFCSGFMNCYLFLCPITIDAAEIKVKMILDKAH